MKISKIYAQEVLDSRANPTIKASVVLENGEKVKIKVAASTLRTMKKASK